MRTTLELDDDVLQAAKELAQRTNSTAGRVISDLARRSLTAHPKSPASSHRGGVPVLPSRGQIVTMEKVRQLLDEEGA